MLSLRRRSGKYRDLRKRTYRRQFGGISQQRQYLPPDADPFLRCRQIHIEDIRLCDAAAWTTAFLDSEYIWISKVYIHNEKRYNGDGLDFDGCAHVFIDNCSITGTDDNLCLQSSSKEYPVKDIHISNCEFTSLCAGIRIGLKSIGDIYNVVISNCTMDRVWREGIKIECTEGGSISDIMIQNVTMRDVTRPVL